MTEQHSTLTPAMTIQQITAKLEANGWQLACLTPEERAFAIAYCRKH